MVTFLHEVFIGLLTIIVNDTKHKKCVSLSNWESTTQSNLINLHPNECTQELPYYPFFD